MVLDQVLRSHVLQPILKLLLVIISLVSPAILAEHTDTVKDFVKAFNDKNVDGMLSLAAPDMKYMFVVTRLRPKPLIMPL